eukprot:jgi/Psemu1/24905/gm1.24905_g
MEEIEEIAKEVLEGLSNLWHDDEAVEVDRGYKGDDKMKLPDMGFTRIERKMKLNARAQHETGMMQKHKICFKAVAVITKLKLASDEITFEDGLEYDLFSRCKKGACPFGFNFDCDFDFALTTTIAAATLAATAAAAATLTATAAFSVIDAVVVVPAAAGTDDFLWA